MTNEATYAVLISLTLGVSYTDRVEPDDLEAEAETLSDNLTKAIPNMFKYYPSYELSNLQVEVDPLLDQLK